MNRNYGVAKKKEKILLLLKLSIKMTYPSFKIKKIEERIF